MVKRRSAWLALLAATAVTVASASALTVDARPAQALCLVVCIPIGAPAGGVGTGTAFIPISPVIGGGDYVRRGTKPAYLLSVIVAPNGSAISSSDVQFSAGSCSGGSHYSAGALVTGPAAISAADTATVSKTGFPATVTDRSGHRHRGRESVTLGFAFHGLTLSGTLNDYFSAGRFRCRASDVQLSGTRAGSAGAPFFNATAGSGSYAGRLPAGRWSANVYVPLGVVSSARIPWRVTCDKQRVSGTSVFSDVPVDGAQFSDRTDTQKRLAHHLAATIETTSSGRFSATRSYAFGGGSDHSFRLALRTTTTVKVRGRHGRLARSCRASSSDAVSGGTPVPTA